MQELEERMRNNVEMAKTTNDIEAKTFKLALFNANDRRVQVEAAFTYFFKLLLAPLQQLWKLI